MTDYHALFFAAGFVLFLVITLVLILPLTILRVVKVFKPAASPGTILMVLIAISTSLACVSFGFMITTISVFSYIPYYAAGLIITAFIILLFFAFKPWKPGFFRKGTHIYLCFVLVFAFIFFWILVALTRDACVTAVPYSLSVYQTRKLNGDSCAKKLPAPCHTYLTFGTNASSTVIVHFHTAKEFTSPVVRLLNSTLSGQVTAVGIKMDLEIKRWVYYGELSGLEPDTTYHFVAGDLADPASYTAAHKFRTAPLDQSFSFASGGDLGMSPNAKTLLEISASLEPLYISLGGDLAYANAMKPCYPRWDAWLDMYEKAAKTPTGYTVPIITSVGNHEAGGFNQPLSHLPFYTRYFVQESLNGRLPQDLPTYNSKYIGNQLMLSLDSSVITSPKDQANWVSSELSKASPGTFKTAMYHAPGYPSVRSFSNSESSSIRSHFVPVFDTHKLHVAFENHDHAYKRTKILKGGVSDPTGTLYIGDGSMGATSRLSAGNQPIPSNRDYLEVLNGDNFVLFITVTDSNYSISAINTKNAIFDRVSHPIN